MIEIKMPSIKEFAYDEDRNKRKIVFSHYRDGKLFYNFSTKEKNYQLAIDLSHEDTKGITIPKEDDATLYKRIYNHALKNGNVFIV